uniref:Putative lipocalin-3 1 n=1 Tax=Amblyomma cajennense TaxID=34607 RepID=A0A023FS95_AMBCJ
MAMSCSQALWAIVLIAMCSNIGNGNKLQDNGNNIDIRKAVNTTDKLWLLWQTYRNGFDVCTKDICIKVNETCIYNMMINITKEEYYFNQTITWTERDDTTNYKGTFKDGIEPPKSMEVYEITDDPSDGSVSDDGQHQTWTLSYLDPDDYRCMVFAIGELDNEVQEVLGTCDMYIRGTPRKSDPPSGCEEFFRQRCNVTAIYKPYTDDCIKAKDSAVPIGGGNQLPQ